MSETKLTVQEEIFCKWFMHTLDKPLSAYQAGYLSNIKMETDFEKLTLAQNKNLHRQANVCLKKPKIQKRIFDLTEELAKKHKKATLEECLSFATAVMRKAKYDYFEDEKSVSQALRACEILLRHYPEYEKGAGASEDKYVFHRRKIK